MMGEQEDEEAAGEEEFGSDEELDLGDEEFDFEDDEEFGFEGDDSGLDDQVPDAMSDGEDLCPCPDDGEEVEIDFDELAQQIEMGDEQPEQDHEEAAEDVIGDDDEMLEELEIDMEPTKSGTTNRPEKEVGREMDKEFTDDEDSEDDDEEEEIQDNSDVIKDQEKINELKSEVKFLENKLEQVKEGHKELKQERDEFHSKLLETNKKLQEVNTQRAKFFYKSCVLESSSLNERQKQRLAEALEDAESAKDAERIYEHVTNALEQETISNKSNKQARTISEAVDNSTPNESIKVQSTQNKKREKSTMLNENVKKRFAEIAGLKDE